MCKDKKKSSLLQFKSIQSRSQVDIDFLSVMSCHVIRFPELFKVILFALCNKCQAFQIYTAWTFLDPQSQ